MEVEYTHEEKVLVKCPHCGKEFVYAYSGEGTTEVEPPDRDEDG